MARLAGYPACNAAALERSSINYHSQSRPKGERSVSVCRTTTQFWGKISLCGRISAETLPAALRPWMSHTSSLLSPLLKYSFNLVTGAERNQMVEVEINRTCACLKMSWRGWRVTSRMKRRRIVLASYFLSLLLIRSISCVNIESVDEVNMYICANTRHLESLLDYS